MRKRLAVTILISFALAGCRAKEIADKEAIKSDLEKRGTVDLMKQVADDKYTPPADGKLTDGQVQMYLKVREHEKQIAQVAKQEAQQHAQAADKAGKSITGMMEGFKTLSAAAEMATADVRAAKDLHYNTQEYLWVKGQIIAASTAAMAAKVGDAMNAQMDASYQQMKKAYDEAKDEQQKKVYADLLANMEKSKQETAQQQKVDPAIEYNRQLLSKYENALNAFTNEMAKWEDKPGEAQKSMDQFNKDVEKAKADAQKK
jgi:hypothetical protein